MSHFNVKTLTFYGVAIASVLVLFKTVTAYGESNLQAPPVIGDRYRLTLTNNLPNCKKLDSLILKIQQSGIYLNASLLPATVNVDTEKSLPLTGIFTNKQFNLVGKIDTTILCNVAPPHSVTIKTQLASQGSLIGQLSIRGIPQTLEFNATPEAAQTSEKSNSH